MKAVLLRSGLVVCGLVCMASSAAAQPPVGALAVDERQGDRYGWAVDYSTASAARAAALGECGPGCSAVLTFERCAAYAADQDAASTAVGWAESYGSAAGARGAALSACGSRGGSGCIVRVGRGRSGAAVRRVGRFRRGSRPRASTRAVRTGCSAPGPGRRLVAGSRLEERVRRAIWTVRRRRRCGRQAPRRGRSGNSLLPSGRPRFPRGSSRHRRVSRPLRPRRPRRPRSSRVCSGSR